MQHAIGGYFELECGRRPMYHADGVLLNSARNALRYIIRAYEIREMYAPYYTCPVVWQAILAENVKIIPYDIDANFMPTIEFPENAFILYNNYFGICGDNVDRLAARYPRLIVDNAQSFFSKKQGLAAFYSPRKFFGLPDGGIAVCDRHAPDNLDIATSYDLCAHLLKRPDLGATGGYADFQANDGALVNRPVEAMSRLTRAIMGNIDHDFARTRRLKNFQTLHNALGQQNNIKIELKSCDVPMVYPYRVNDTTLRGRLIENQIFVAKYWPAEDGCECMQSAAAAHMAQTIVPLPIDQRYDADDMRRILETINV